MRAAASERWVTMEAVAMPYPTTAKESNQPQPGSPLLLVVGEGHLSTHALDGDRPLVLGRDATCDIAIDHPRVSRRHAIVHPGATPTVQDLGSTNGVYVDDRRLDRGERRELVAGASFRVGPFRGVIVGDPSASGAAVDGRAALTVADPRPEALSDVIRRVARSQVSVLITGETGAGKDVLARALHTVSERTGPLLGINCAALSELLLESELFGHERGAFTGAVGTKPGLFEAAAGGTVFLDEIGEMPPPLQAKLLRAIESRQVLRVGGVRPIELDVRFVAATHRDLRADAAHGTFRRDLYFRLNGITLALQPLRERREAIRGLADEFLAAATAGCDRAARPRLTAAALALLVRHDWPGNVRELKAVIERALLLAADDAIDVPHIVLDPPLAAVSDRSEQPVDRPDGIDRADRDRIVAALDASAGNQTRAARALGMSRATLAHKLALYRIPRPRSR